MKLLLTLFVSVSLLVASLAEDEEVSTRRFPDNFLFGYASAAYQIEGGWDQDGKGESIWDYDAHNHPERWPVGDSHTGDIACDSYNKWAEDVALLKEVGVGAYRFSISWSRILPDGSINNINQAGIDYYKKLIAALKEANIIPIVTMHHWDIPQALEEQGGFLNHSIIGNFVNYARVLFDNFGDDITYWTTFNEPKQTCEGGYGSGGFAPQNLHPGFGGYLCAFNLLRAHGQAYQMYNNEFRARQNGLVGMVIDTTWYEPATDSAEDAEAAETILQFMYGLYGNPIVHGDWPAVVKERIAMRSEKEGYSKSRLPAFSDAEIEYIKGSYDYLAINMYTSMLASHSDEPAFDLPPANWKDISVATSQPEDWEQTVTSWFKVYPVGARRLVNWIKKTYGDEKGIIVTENGYHDDGTVTEDMDTRGRYHKNYMSNINKAIHEDGVNVTGYMAWSLLDDIEWYAGHLVELGHYSIDWTSPNRTRTPKASSSYYHKVVTTRCLVDECTD